MDWLDKVRIGLWLGFIQLNKQQINPLFHIENRIGQYDRILIIEKSDFPGERLNFGGTDTMSFQFRPSAFLLIINNIYLTNISSAFLISRRIGFPFPKHSAMQSNTSDIEITIEKGLERIIRPILRKETSEIGTIIYQPMFEQRLFKTETNIYNSKYVKENCINHKNGIGNIFVEKDKKITKLHNSSTANITPKNQHIDSEKFIRSSISIIEWQNWLEEQNIDIDHLTNEEKTSYKKFKKLIKTESTYLIKLYWKHLHANRKLQKKCSD